MSRSRLFIAVGCILLLAVAAPCVHAQAVYDPSGLHYIEAEAYDGASGALLATGGPWLWSAGLWILDNIPPGEDIDLRVVMSGEDGSGIYWGQLDGLSVQPNLPFSMMGALMLMATDEGIYVLIPPFTPGGVITPIPFHVDVPLDILPGSTKNPFNVKARGRLPVVVLGSEDVDVADINVDSLLLAGCAPLKATVEDVCTLVLEEDTDEISAPGPDGLADLVLHFDRPALAETLDDAEDGDVVPWVLTGEMNDGTRLEGLDAVTILKKGRPERASRPDGPGKDKGQGKGRGGRR